MSKFFQSKIEKDFENFVRSLPKLEPVEFCGLAKVLGVSMYRDLEDMGFSIEELKSKSEEELSAIEKEMTLPLDDVLEKMMDKFLTLNKKRRREINQILKDIKLEKRNQEVKKNGTST